MRFLIVADRELRAAARRKATYYVRWLTAAGFFLLLIWVMWALDALTSSGRAHDVFSFYSVIVLFYCLFVGAIRTADCIGSERREGTLGLLFLTNLNSAEIIAGKLCSNAVPTVYGLLAIFPMLAMPLLIGGVTLAEFLKSMLALVVAILFALGCGFVSTVVCRRHFPAVALALGLVLSLGTLTFAAAGIIHEYRGPAWLVQGLASLSPLYALAASVEGRILGANHYWLAVGNVAAISVLSLGLATLWLARSWRDRAKASRRVQGTTAVMQPVESRRRARRDALRKRLLNINPFYWLAGRRQISSPVFMLIVALLALATVFITTPFFVKLVGSVQHRQTLGAMLAWLCTGSGLHLLTLYYAAMVSSQAVAEDKQAGALELIFSAPIKVTTILDGLGAAFRRRMFFPAFAVTLTHAYCVWLIMKMALLEPPGPAETTGMTPWGMLWASLLNLPVRGRLLEWEFVMAVRTVVLVLPLAFVLWFTLGRVGRWLGLRMKHPGFAPLVALALLTIPPTLVFSLGCYIADDAHVYRYSDRLVIPAFVGSAFAMLLLHCAIITGWASRNLRENFRQTVIGRPDKVRRTWRDRGRTALKFALKVAAVGLAIGLLVMGYYAYQNHRSRRAWADFRAEMKQAGISLETSSLLPTPVADAMNFARSEEFQRLANNTNSPLAGLLARTPSPNWAIQPWRKQQPAVLANFVDCIGMGKAPAGTVSQPYQPGYNQGSMPTTPASFDGPTNNAELAPLVLDHLKPLSAELEGIAAVARRPWFQPGTNRTALAVLGPSSWEINAVARLHLLYTLRSLASLHARQPDSAARDLLTGLHLARLTGQLPNAEASLRAQLMLISSLQPLWEGLGRHPWSEAQLAEFQAQLTTLSPISDFTNAIGRVVLANIEIWKRMPELPQDQWKLPAPNGTYSSSDWAGMPSDWWLDCCIQLYRAGEDVIAGVEENNGRKFRDLNWASINDLPLSGDSQQLFQRAMPYWGYEQPNHITIGQIALDQARLAIALERHRLATHRYPATLGELVPTHIARIPCDVNVGRPMLYEPLTNGSYVLRGLGQNRRNDATNSHSDDNLWAYPTNRAAMNTLP